MKPYAIAILTLVALFFSGCQGDRAHREDAARMAANGYAAAQAAMEGADAQACLTAVRLYFAKIAEIHGYRIVGADAWIQTIQKGGAK